MRLDLQTDSNNELEHKLRKTNPFHLRRLYEILEDMKAKRYFRFKPKKNDRDRR